MQQETFIPGLPKRLGVAIIAAMGKTGYRKETLQVIQEAQAECILPLTADEDAIYNAADRASRDCYSRIAQYMTTDAALLAIGIICRSWGVAAPAGEEAREIMARAVDREWWRRQLRKRVAREVEHVAIRAGVVCNGGQPYISDHSAIKQAKRNAANRKGLENTIVKNVQTGQEYDLAKLADKGTGNKANRRAEFMTRIRGFEEIAEKLNHVPLFFTITCPSKFHSVGGTNRKYNGATPRQAQAYLCDVWKRIRAKLQREEIRPYGFRIAEPHTDGCPHWHMLFFVERAQADRMAVIIREYALAEDAGEWEHEDNRCKLVRIKTGVTINGKKLSAAGYIAKYVSKNIDGTGVGDHKAFENGETYTIKADMFGKWELTPSMRVTYWSQVWGIRQFQQIGGVPVGIWREFRRVEEATIAGAPEYVRKAWDAAQRETGIQVEVVDGVSTQKEVTTKQADYCAFMEALGGPRVGRNALVQLDKRGVGIDGRYGPYIAQKPVGLYTIAEGGEVLKYAGVHYTWARIGERVAVPFGVAVGVTRTGVNNCTEVDHDAVGLRMWLATRDLSDQVKNQKFSAPAWVDWPEIRRTAKEIQKASDKFAWRRNQRD